MPDPVDDQFTPQQQIEEEVREIAWVLLNEHPPGTPMAEVWQEALTLHRVRYETEVLPAPPTETREQSRNRTRAGTVLP